MIMSNGPSPSIIDLMTMRLSKYVNGMLELPELIASERISATPSMPVPTVRQHKAPRNTSRKTGQQNAELVPTKQRHAVFARCSAGLLAVSVARFPGCVTNSIESQRDVS